MAGFGKGGFIGQGDRTSPSACGGGGIFRMEDLTSPEGLAVTSTSFNLKYLVIAGGGGGGNYAGGGAGGYRASMPGELSGGACPAEPNPKITSGTQYCVVVGAGGAGAWPVPGASDERGGDSRFDTICSCGGGRAYWSSPSPKEVDARPGGSGGGAASGTPGGGTGITSQGTPGGNAPGGGGAGGGGACTAGCNGSSGPGYPHGIGGSGGCGILSCITGTSVGRGGGGGGGAFVQSPVPSAIQCNSQGCGGRGGGYSEGLGPFAPSFPDYDTFGAANRGGGAGNRAGNQANGGSGVVILRYPSEFRICGSPGLTISTTFAGSGECASSVTAGTGNVSWSKA